MDWQYYLEMMAINAGVGAIYGAVKNPEHAARLKGVLLHLMDTICTTYGLTHPVHE